MEGIEVVAAEGPELTLRHTHTGHVFTFRVGGDGPDGLAPGPVREGHGPKTPGDVAADVRAFAREEAKRRGMV